MNDRYYKIPKVNEILASPFIRDVAKVIRVEKLSVDKPTIFIIEIEVIDSKFSERIGTKSEVLYDTAWRMNNENCYKRIIDLL